MKRAVVLILLSAVAGFLAVVAVDFATDGGRALSSPSAGRDQAAAQPSDGSAETGRAAGQGAESPAADEPDEPDDGGDASDEGDDDDEAEEPLTEEEKREAEEEQRVDAFDDLTDKWMEPAEKGVTMADVDNFAKFFRQVPAERQDECVHRALNLIPDENAMLLAGILMDKSIDTEIVETVFNDVLNRDEDVKQPILKQIFKDTDHPCWTDAAWILDATGSLPASE